MRTLPTDLETLSTTNYGTEPINILKIEWDAGTLFYADKSLGDGDGSSAANAIGTILQIGAISSRLDSINQAHTNSFSVKLIDTEDTETDYITFLDKLQDESFYNIPCTLYQGYTSISDTIEILKGDIKSPITWSEDERTISFSVETKLDESEVGFSTTHLQFDYTTPDFDDQVWPLCFGKVVNVPALQISGLLKGTLQEPIDLASVGYPTISVTNGRYFPQSTQLDLVIDGLDFTGSFSNDDLTLSSTVLPKFTSVTLGARDSDDPGYGSYHYLWLDSTSYANGVRLVGHWCKMTYQDLPWVNKCIAQKGTRCYFKYAWPDLLGSESTLDATSIVGVSDWGSSNIGRDYEYMLTTYKIVINTDQTIDSGSTIYIDSHDANIKYIANIAGGSSTDVVGVSAYRTVNGKRFLAPIPSSYYTIDKTYDPSDDFASSFDEPTELTKPTSCVLITLDYALSFYDQEGWEDSGIYVSMVCQESGDATDAIEYIIDNYTEINIDTDTFGDVSALITNQEINFVINEKRNALEVCREIAYQSGCALVIDYDTIYIRALFDEPDETQDVTLDDTVIDIDSIEISQTNYLDILTRLEVEYYLDYSKEPSKLITEFNTDTYGQIPLQETWWTHNSQALVQEMSNFWLGRFSRSWRIINFRTYLNALPLEIFDHFTLDLTDDLLGTDSIICMIRDISHDTLTGKISIEAWLPIEAGTVTASGYAYATLSAVSDDLTTGLATKDYVVDQLQDGTATSSGTDHSPTHEEDTEEVTLTELPDTETEPEEPTTTATEILWCEVIRPITAPDPLSSTMPTGKSWYTVRIASEPDDWSSTTDYAAGATCTYNGDIYTATNWVDHPNNDIVGKAPIAANVSLIWALTDEVIISKAIGMGDSDLRDCFPWYERGDTVPIILEDGVYYFLQTITYAGSPSASTLRWNVADTKVQAVFM